MSLSIFAFCAVVLTCAMFAKREAMLGFPCFIFWALLLPGIFISYWDLLRFWVWLRFVHMPLSGYARNGMPSVKVICRKAMVN